MKEAIRELFLNDWVKEATNEEIVSKLIENDNRAKEIERLNNIINECSNDILKELEENHHLSYGVALAIRQKLLDYKELKRSGKE